MAKRSLDDQRAMVSAITRIEAGSCLKIEFTDKPFRGATEATALRRLLDASAPNGNQLTIRNGRRVDFEKALTDGCFVGNLRYFFDITRVGEYLVGDFRTLVGAGLAVRVSKA